MTFQKRCGLDCGSLNAIDPREFIGSGFAMRCGLLKSVQPCWKKCVTAGMGFAVSFALASLGVLIRSLPVACRIKM